MGQVQAKPKWIVTCSSGKDEATADELIVSVVLFIFGVQLDF